MSRGILLPCPRCGEKDASIDASLAEFGTFHCRECDEEFDAATIAELVERWRPVLAWIESAPAGKDGGQ